MMVRIPVHSVAMFDVLRELAGNRRTITYGELANRCGGSAIGANKPLDYILFNICEPRGLPHLNALAVSKARGFPGTTYQPHGHPVTRHEWEKIVGQVFATDWSDIEFE